MALKHHIRAPIIRWNGPRRIVGAIFVLDGADAHAAEDLGAAERGHTERDNR